jgi:hypothetical protein
LISRGAVSQVFNARLRVTYNSVTPGKSKTIVTVVVGSLPTVTLIILVSPKETREGRDRDKLLSPFFLP